MNETLEALIELILMARRKVRDAQRLMERMGLDDAQINSLQSDLDNNYIACTAPVLMAFGGDYVTAEFVNYITSNETFDMSKLMNVLENCIQSSALSPDSEQAKSVVQIAKAMDAIRNEIAAATNKTTVTDLEMARYLLNVTDANGVNIVEYYRDGDLASGKELVIDANDPRQAFAQSFARVIFDVGTAEDARQMLQSSTNSIEGVSVASEHNRAVYDNIASMERTEAKDREFNHLIRKSQLLNAQRVEDDPESLRAKSRMERYGFEGVYLKDMMHSGLSYCMAIKDATLAERESQIISRQQNRNVILNAKVTRDIVFHSLEHDVSNISRQTSGHMNVETLSYIIENNTYAAQAKTFLHSATHTPAQEKWLRQFKLGWEGDEKHPPVPSGMVKIFLKATEDFALLATPEMAQQAIDSAVSMAQKELTDHGLSNEYQDKDLHAMFEGFARQREILAQKVPGTKNMSERMTVNLNHLPGRVAMGLTNPIYYGEFQPSVRPDAVLYEVMIGKFEDKIDSLSLKIESGSLTPEDRLELRSIVASLSSPTMINSDYIARQTAMMELNHNVYAGVILKWDTLVDLGVINLDKLTIGDLRNTPNSELTNAQMAAKLYQEAHEDLMEAYEVVKEGRAYITKNDDRFKNLDSELYDKIYNNKPITMEEAATVIEAMRKDIDIYKQDKA